MHSFIRGVYTYLRPSAFISCFKKKEAWYKFKCSKIYPVFLSLKDKVIHPCNF
jgi:hypothetical protein